MGSVPRGYPQRVSPGKWAFSLFQTKRGRGECNHSFGNLGVVSFMCHLHGATRHPLDRMNVTLGVSRSLAVAGRVFRGQLSIGIGGLGKADAVPSMGPRPTHPGPDGAKGRPGRSAPRRCLTAGLGTSRPLLLPGPGPPASAPLGLGLRAGAEAQSPLSWASARRYRDFSVTTRACNNTSPSPGRSLAATPASRCSVCVHGVCAHTHTGSPAQAECQTH